MTDSSQTNITPAPTALIHYGLPSYKSPRTWKEKQLQARSVSPGDSSILKVFLSGLGLFTLLLALPFIAYIFN